MKDIVRYIITLFVALVVVWPQYALTATTSREQEVRDAVTEFISTRTAGLGWDVQLRRLTISDALKLPEGEIEYEIVAPKQWEGWGNLSVAVIARQKDRVVRNIPVRLEVDASTNMVVTLHQIDHGTLITASDITVQKREISQNSYQAARTIEEVSGKKARTTLRANQPVRSDQVEKVPLVKSGQMVTIVAENEVLKVSVAGKAKSSGAEGDIIKVQNLSSLKEIPARVIDASTVQVGF